MPQVECGEVSLRASSVHSFEKGYLPVSLLLAKCVGPQVVKGRLHYGLCEQLGAAQGDTSDHTTYGWNFNSIVSPMSCAFSPLAAIQLIVEPSSSY